jgi:hypothetical protein
LGCVCFVVVRCACSLFLLVYWYFRRGPTDPTILYLYTRIVYIIYDVCSNPRIMRIMRIISIVSLVLVLGISPS